MDVRIGELAALGTAVSWTATVLFFEASSRRVGSIPVNILRLVVAFGLFTAYGSVVRAHPLPTDFSAHGWWWLTVSGLVGFTLGDLCLFEAFVLIGARLASLAMAMVAPLVALMGLVFLGEKLAPRDVLGIVLAVSGVVWVVSERTRGRFDTGHDPRHRALGVALALGGALGQAGGLILSKIGMGDGDAFAATHIRVIAGTVGFAAVFTVVGWWPRVWAAVRDRTAMTHLSLGAFFGPFLGVGLSLLAVQRAPAGIAATIMALTPVLMIPAVRVLRGEHASARATLGAILAVAGVAVLFL